MLTRIEAEHWHDHVNAAQSLAGHVQCHVVVETQVVAEPDDRRFAHGLFARWEVVAVGSGGGRGGDSCGLDAVPL